MHFESMPLVRYLINTMNSEDGEFMSNPGTLVRTTMRVAGLSALMLLSFTIGASAQTDTGAGAWQQVTAQPGDVSSTGHARTVRPRKFRAFNFNRGQLKALVAAAPHERTRAAREGKMVVSLPAPG